MSENAYDVPQDIRQQCLDRAINLAANGRIQPEAVLTRAEEFADFVKNGLDKDPTEGQIESAQELGNIATKAIQEGDSEKFAHALDTLSEESDKLTAYQGLFLLAEFVDEIRENLAG